MNSFHLLTVTPYESVKRKHNSEHGIVIGWSGDDDLITPRRGVEISLLRQHPSTQQQLWVMELLNTTLPGYQCYYESQWKRLMDRIGAPYMPLSARQKIVKR